MSALKDRLQTDLTTAMKARDELRLATLRMALTAIKNAEVSGGEAREIDDEEVLAVVRRETKKRRESAEAYDAAGRPELAERERAEGVVLEEYLPAQLGDAELSALVEEAVTEAGATGPQQMGQVMKLLTPRIAGRADGGRVAAEVKRRLTGG